jgi:hypothetical protein
MGYIGAQPATNFETVRKQVSTTNSGTTITLDFAVSSVQDILVTVNAVVQSYDNYSVSGTTLTLGGTLNNDRVEILYVGRTFQTVTPAIGTVTNDMLSGSIANSKLANSSITLNGSAVSLGGSATIGGGKLLQFVNLATTSNVTVSSTSYTSGNLSQSFTPTASSSKVFILLQLGVFLNVSTSQDAGLQVSLRRDSSEIMNSGTTSNYQSAAYNGNTRYTLPLIYYDTPNTTSAVTYDYQFKNAHSSQTIEISDNNTISTMSLFEIGA